MKYNFDEIIDRRGTGSLKWEMNYMLESVCSDNEINSMWVADMDFPCPEPIVDAISKRARHPIYGYSYYDKEKMPGVLCEWVKKRYDWNVVANDIFYAPGVVAAINYIINGFTNPGEGIIIQPPVYYPFRKTIKGNNRTVIDNPLINEGGYYRMNYKDLEEKASVESTTMMILCSPHNPVGRVWTEQELVQTGEICERNGVLLVSDEIHSDLIRDDSQFIPVAKAGNPENTLTCTAPSKTFNIPGLMISATIIQNSRYQKIWKKHAYGISGLGLPNPFGAEAFVAAYTEGGEWLGQVNEYIDRNLAWLEEFISTELPSVKYKVPEGTYLAWLDFKETGWPNDRELASVLEKQAGILIDPGSIFGEQGKGFIRINTACPRSKLEQAMKKIKSTLGI